MQLADYGCAGNLLLNIIQDVTSRNKRSSLHCGESELNLGAKQKLLSREDIATAAALPNFLESEEERIPDVQHKGARSAGGLQFSGNIRKLLQRAKDDFIENNIRSGPRTQNVMLVQIVLFPNVPSVLYAAVETFTIGGKDLLCILQCKDVPGKACCRHKASVARFCKS